MSRYLNIFKEIEKRKPQVILEVGTWNGGHACEMIRKAQEFSPDKQIGYFGFDLFEEFQEADTEFCPKTPAKLKEVQARLDYTGATCILAQGNTKKTLADFHPAVNIDFMFIDGGHSLETIESDWRNLAKYVLSTTTVLFDDYYLNREDVGCKQLIYRLEKDPAFLITYLSPVDKFNDLEVRMIKLQRI